MRNQLGEWAQAARAGAVGVAQSEAMARVTANPRIDPDVLARDAGMLLDDAINLPYVEFERNLRTWEARADPVGDHTRNERAHQRRADGLSAMARASVSRDPNTATPTTPRPTKSAVTWCAIPVGSPRCCILVARTSETKGHVDEHRPAQRHPGDRSTAGHRLGDRLRHLGSRLRRRSEPGVGRPARTVPDRPLRPLGRVVAPHDVCRRPAVRPGPRPLLLDRRRRPQLHR